jgi:hypothetical protein
MCDVVDIAIVSVFFSAPVLNRTFIITEQPQKYALRLAVLETFVLAFVYRALNSRPFR